MTLSDMQARSPNRSAFLRLAQKYGLAQVPRNWQEAMAMLQPILNESQLELVRYLFMPPEEFIAEDNIFPPGAPQAPVVAQEPPPVKDTAAAAVTPTAPATPATGAPATPTAPAAPPAAPAAPAAPAQPQPNLTQVEPGIQKVDGAAPTGGDRVAPEQRVRFVWTDPATGAKTNIY